MGVRENKVESYLNKEVVKLGGITRKWTNPSMAGDPDRIIILRALIVFVEVKTVAGKLAPEQIREHERLIAHGAIVKTVYGEGGVDDFIKWLKRVSTTPSSSI
jgi:hypothetical protein